MPGGQIGSLFVRVRPNAAGFAAEARSQLGPSMAELGRSLNGNLAADAEQQAQRMTEALTKERRGIEAVIGALKEQMKVSTTGSEEQISQLRLLQDAQRRYATTVAETSRVTQAASGHVQHHGRLLRDVREDARGASAEFLHLGRAIAFASTPFVVGAVISHTFKQTMDAASNLEERMGQLGNVVRNVGGNWTALAPEIKKGQEELARASGFTVSELLPGLTRLVAATHSTGKAQRDEALATNLARTVHEDYALAIRQVTMLEQGRLTTIRGLGISLPKVTTAQDALKVTIAQHAAAHEKLSKAELLSATAAAKLKDREATAEAQIKAVTAAVKGGDATFAASYQGHLAKFNVALETLKETIGTALIPIFKKWVDDLTGWITRMDESGRLQKDVTTAVNDFKTAVSTAGAILGGIIAVIRRVDAVTGGLGNTLKIVGIALAANKVREWAQTWITNAVRVASSATATAAVQEGAAAGAATANVTAATVTSVAWRSAMVAVKGALISTGLGAVAVAIGIAAVEIIKHWNTIKGWFEDFGRWISKHWWITYFIPVFGQFIFVAGQIVKNWGAVKKWFEDFAGDFVKLFTHPIAAVEALFTDLANAVKGIFDKLIGSIADLVSHIPKLPGWVPGSGVVNRLREWGQNYEQTAGDIGAKAGQALAQSFQSYVPGAGPNVGLPNMTSSGKAIGPYVKGTFLSGPPGRTDEGVDFGATGAPARAFAAGRITNIIPNWYKKTGTPLVAVTLRSPISINGRTYDQIYYAEQQLMPGLHVGSKITAGQPILLPGANEIGFGAGGQAAAAAYYREGMITQAGADFADLLGIAHGAVQGAPTGGGGGGGGGGFNWVSTLKAHKAKAVPALQRLLGAGLANQIAGIPGIKTPDEAGRSYAADKAAIAAIDKLLSDGVKAEKDRNTLIRERKSLHAQEESAAKVLAKASNDALKAQIAARERSQLGIGGSGTPAAPGVTALRDQISKFRTTISHDVQANPLFDPYTINKQLDLFNSILKNKFVPDDVKSTIRDRISAMRQTTTQQMQTFIQSAQTAASAATSAFEEVWSRIANAGLAAFDRVTQKHVQQMQEQISAVVEQMQEAGSAPTPSEAALAALQASRTALANQRSLESAQKALGQAKTPEEILSAQQQLEEAQVSIQEQGLQAQANAERKAQDASTKRAIDEYQKQAQAEIQSYQDQRDAQHQAIQDQIEQWKILIEAGMVPTSDALQAIKKVFHDSGVEIDTNSIVIGGQFYNLATALDPSGPLGKAVDSMIQKFQDLTRAGGQVPTSLDHISEAQAAALGLTTTQAAARQANALLGLALPGPSGLAGPQNIGLATGGSFIANRLTRLFVGEGGNRERINVTPLGATDDPMARAASLTEKYGSTQVEQGSQMIRLLAAAVDLLSERQQVQVTIPGVTTPNDVALAAMR